MLVSVEKLRNFVRWAYVNCTRRKAESSVFEFLKRIVNVRERLFGIVVETRQITTMLTLGLEVTVVLRVHAEAEVCLLTTFPDE